MADFTPPDYLEEVTSPSSLTTGDIIRRRGNGKDLQGVFVKLDEDGASLLVADIVDVEAGEFLTEGAKLKIGEGDALYRYTKTFQNSDHADAARKVFLSWVLLKDHPHLHDEIVQFFEAVFSPEQILEYKKGDNLRMIFVPAQGRFKIGKFREKVDWAKVRDDKFTETLNSLADEKHITYIAFIPTDQQHKPLFYTEGTKDHEDMIKDLQKQPYSFKPTHGGHLKIVSGEDEPKRFLVDAGANELGAGVKTSVATAQIIADALHEIYPDYEFVPVHGRDAYGATSSGFGG